MKYFFFPLLLLSLILLTACNHADDENKEFHDKIGICDFVYPISYLMEDGTVITVDDKDEAAFAFHSGKDDNSKGDDKVEDEQKDKGSLQYPVQFIDATGKILTLTNEVELKKAFEGCEKDTKTKCKKDPSKADPDYSEECG